MSRDGPNWVGREVWGVLAFIALLVGCHGAPDEPSRKPATQSERAADAGRPEPALADVVQLTTGFTRAGEAYFSPDARWIVFEASPPGEQHYQMYVGPLRWQGDRIAGLDTPVRISPPNSRNTCGYFSPDGNSLIFASTAGKEDPDEPAAGYQRHGGSYRWDFPSGMEIFRADDWKKSVELVTKTKAIDLAKNPITRNDAYDAE